VVVHIFLVVDDELALLMIIDEYCCSCGFCTKVICTLTCLVI
jgi:hypothetical protein